MSNNEKITDIYGIKSEDYKAENVSVEFVPNNTFDVCDKIYHYSSIMLNDKQIGVLEEIRPYSILKPIKHTFKVYVNEMYEPKNEYEKNHLIYEEFGTAMCFPTLQDAITFYENNKNIVE